MVTSIPIRTHSFCHNFWLSEGLLALLLLLPACVTVRVWQRRHRVSSREQPALRLRLRLRLWSAGSTSRLTGRYCSLKIQEYIEECNP